MNVFYYSHYILYLLSISLHESYKKGLTEKLITSEINDVNLNHLRFHLSLLINVQFGLKLLQLSTPFGKE